MSGMNWSESIRQKAQGTTDAPFWNAVADEIERLRAEIADLRKAQGKPVAWASSLGDYADVRWGSSSSIHTVPLYALAAAPSIREANCETALHRYTTCDGDSETDPLERLRFFCSCAMRGQDWLDCERFFDTIIDESPFIPEGWQLVPVEPTPEMLDATFGKNTHGILKERVLKLRKEDYITMLAAAPKYGVDKQ